MEIKFRAWVRNYMVDVVSIDFINKYITWDNNQYDRCVPPNKCYEVESFEDIKLMQFTGYKDYEGKNIYEGDIISAPNGQIKKALIYFSQSTFWYKEWDEVHEEWHHSEMGWCEQYGRKEIGILHWSANRIALEVIGNVHEHPELISGRHEA